MHRSFAPKVREVTVRGETMWEVDCRPWRDRVRALGHPVRRRFPHPDLARQWIQEMVVDLATGTRQSLDSEVRALCDRYLESVKRSDRSEATVRTYRSRIRTFRRWCERRGLTMTSEIAPAVIDQYRMHCHDRYSPSGLHGAMVVVAAMFGWAVSRGYIDSDPSRGLVPPKPKGTRRALTDEERRKVYEESDPRWRHLWVFLLHTGLRRGELTSLRPADVVTDSPAPHVRVTGKGRTRTVLLNDTAGRIAAAWDRIPPISYDHIGRAWAAERERLGIDDDVKLHSLRHDFATRLVNRTSCSITEAARILGHSSVTQTEKYVHRDDSVARRAMGELEAKDGTEAVSPGGGDSAESRADTGTDGS